MQMDLERTAKKIEEFIRVQVGTSKTAGVVIGLSGGIDSTVCAYLAARAIGKEKVLGLIMPERGVTEPEDLIDAMEVVEILGITHMTVEIARVLNEFSISISDYDANAQKACGNLKARTRMCILYYYANKMNRLVLGTGNRTEILLGYSTKYGDAGVDILPIGGLYKSEVRALAKHLKASESIIKKVPTAGLWREQTDEGELGATYENIDNILRRYVDERKDTEAIARELHLDAETVNRIIDLAEKNKHKRMLPPIADIKS